MNNKIFNYLKLAGVIALSKDDNRHFSLGCLGARSDGKIVTALNSPSDRQMREIHAEFKLSRKLDVGSIVYISRVLKNNSFAMAKPCFSCEKALRSKGVKKVYYTISDNEFGVLFLN